MADTSNKETRSLFASKIGIIAAAAGSAIGLGNIWRFPYITGENGGGAFILVYTLILFAIGLPLMISEFVIGRQGKSNPVGTFKKLKPNSKWQYLGLAGVIASIFILAFYSTVAGWTLEYIKVALTNQYHNLSADELRHLFDNFVNNPLRPLMWQTIFIILTIMIIIQGVEKGIERYSKYLMPMLLLIIIILCIRSLTLPESRKGIEFLFNPDFSKINTTVILNALGQAFFSLSLGMGTMIAYGSYIQKKESLPQIALSTSIADTSIAILSGIAIFPAVFSLGFTPQEGTGLVFVVLPQVFNSIPGGQIFAVAFFVLLFIAAITSSISLLEVSAAYLIEEHKLKRPKSAVIAGTTALLIGMLCTLSLADSDILKIGKVTFFNLLENLTSNIMLPICGLFIVLFIGYFMNKTQVKEQLNMQQATTKAIWYKIFMFIIRYIAPIAILLIFLFETGIIKK